MRTTATLENFTIDEIFEAIANIDIRKKWDSNFVTFDLIESNQDGSDLLYMALKVNLKKYSIPYLIIFLFFKLSLIVP